MLANALTHQIGQDIEVVGQGENSFSIEVYKNFVTVDRQHKHTSLIESKTIKVEKDVIIYIHRSRNDAYNLECKWLWRKPTVFENLTFEQANKLKVIISRVATSLRSLAMAKSTLEGIRVGRQVWAKHDIDLDMGLECRTLQSDIGSREVNRTYNYRGAERIEANFPGWRIPTVQDFNDLASFFRRHLFTELTGKLNFGFHGFDSGVIPKKEIDIFLGLNPALQVENGGFYWTSDLDGFEPEKDNFGNRKYFYLNRLTRDTAIKDSANVNDNFFSLRLIRR